MIVIRYSVKTKHIGNKDDSPFSRSRSQRKFFRNPLNPKILLLNYSKSMIVKICDGNTCICVHQEVNQVVLFD